MKRLALALLLPLCLPHAWAVSYSTPSSGSGNWNQPSTWGGAGSPHAGDTCTINGNYVVTVNDSELVGTDVNGSIACTVKSGATLQIMSGGNLSLHGELDCQKGSHCLVLAGPSVASLTLDPAPGNTHKVAWVNSGSGNADFQVVGTSTAQAVVTVSGRGGVGWLDGSLSTPPTWNWQYATFSNLGNATQRGVYFTSTPAFPPTLQNVLFLADGDIALSVNSPTLNFIVDRASFVNCTDTTGSAYHYLCFEFNSSVAPTSAKRLFTNLTAYSPATLMRASFGLTGAQVGMSTLGGDASDVPGLVTYNVNMVSSASSIVRSSFVAMDQVLGGTQCYGTYPNTSQIWQDDICLSHVSNQHEWQGIGLGSGGPNLYQRIVCDGDDFAYIDAGDFVVDQGIAVIKNSLAINLCGTLITALSPTSSNTLLNNTIYWSFGAAIGETAGASSQITVFRNNLIVLPGDPSNLGAGLNQNGIHQNAPFLRQGSLSLDYNAFWQMPGSGDQSAKPVGVNPPMLSSPTLGVASYVRFPLAVVGHDVHGVGGLAAQIATSVNGTTLFCSACNFTSPGGVTGPVQPGDYVMDSAKGNAYALVASVTDSQHLVLAATIPGFASGHSFDVRTSYWSNPGWYYGDANNGAHDLHLDPQFSDKTRSLCTWYVSNGGIAYCSAPGGNPLPSGNAFTATANTDQGDIACSTCHFDVWNIQPGDVVQVYAGTSTTPRGYVAVQAVRSATQLTLASSVAGLTSGDLFTFVTATVGIGKQIVTLNGWDYQGNPTTWQPQWSVMNALTWLRSGFIPTNQALKGAGSPVDGSPDIGAFPVGVPPSQRHRQPAQWRR